MSHRVAVCFGLFALVAVTVGNLAGPASAQKARDKDSDKREAALEKQLRAAQQDIAAGARQLAALRQDVNQLKAANNKLEAANKQLQAALKKEKNDGDDKTIKGLQAALDGLRGAGLVHVVVLKAKADTKPAELQSLIDDSYAQLAKIRTVRGLWAGKPAAKPSPEAVADYTVALVLVFDDAAGLKAYLNDPVHVKFVDRHLKRWEPPVAYDFEPRHRRP